MGRRPKSDTAVRVRVAGVLTYLPQSVLTLLPEAVRFADHLVENRRCDAVTALRYARLVAYAKRDGEVMAPHLITKQPNLTAVRAYWRWIEIHYDARVMPVIKALPHVRDLVGHLRISSLVPPLEGKMIPKRGAPRFTANPMEGGVAELSLEWVPSTAWTLHVPPKPKRPENSEPNEPPIVVPPHQDPCADCAALELSTEQLQVVASVFHAAWGARNPPGVWPPQDLAPESFLFGQPPPTSIYAHQGKDREKVGRIAALVADGPIADTVEQFRGVVTSQPRAFLDRLQQQSADVVVLERTALGDKLNDVLLAIAEMWRQPNGVHEEKSDLMTYTPEV